MNENKKDFTKLLIEKQLVTQEQLEHAYKVHSHKGGSLSDLLVDLGYVDEKDLMIFLSTYLSIPPIKVLNLKVSKEVLELIPKELARKYMVLPIGKLGNALTVAVSDPLNVFLLEDLERLTNCEITPVISSRSELQQAMNIHYKESVTSAIEDIIKDSDAERIQIIEDEESVVADDEIMQSVDEAPVIKLTKHILRRSVEEKASDIFIEPLSNACRVRYRIDGVLREMQRVPKKMHDFVISRIKVIANLNITEHRLPQDGRIRMNIFNNDVDFRVSILPTTQGEKACLRVLDKSAVMLDIDTLGFEDAVCASIKEDSKASYGMFLVCGPTGSGKTTTLYSALSYIYSPEKNIVTVEEPIEYQLAGINQVNVNYEVDLTFASALRSILRQDPDVIMIGEIRDYDTVDIAIKAALTGHLVLSTLHTNTAAGSITRLINMGVEPFLLSSTLIGVLAQRLLRRICPRCRTEQHILEPIREKYKIPKDASIYVPKGCKFCGGFGYKGRVGITEYLHLDSEIRKMVSSNANEHAIQKYARSQGMLSLRDDGLKKVAKGLTSLEEVLRITASDS